jgi:hypothetical protein
MFAIALCRVMASCIADVTVPGRTEMRMKRRRSRVGSMRHLTIEEQIFVQYQIRNWVFGHYGAFKLLNDAWSAHGAEAHFWN